MHISLLESATQNTFIRVNIEIAFGRHNLLRSVTETWRSGTEGEYFWVRVKYLGGKTTYGKPNLSEYGSA